ncbi:hypothetical protein JRO89_XS02G0280800 [Xanthoceras sorbifolium]|uniref:Uncharacterized protein n=1 Tax=Xanthoceras sorbifolium TaxID=99658 RepID=A0ABQ8IHR0_9ROSI|nr:hypothetical protein JRO89_XS02G0280800 [Xanthoceras sorbifolium]
MLRDIVLDIMLLENQLPIFILEGLFKLANPALPERYKGYSLSQFTCSFFNNIWKDILIDEKLLESYFPESRHFVDLLRLLLQPPEHDDTERQANSEAAPSVTKLHQAGIKFKLVSSTKNLLDITYIIENRILDSEGVSTLFLELSRDARIDHSNFYYSGLVKDLQDYCKSPCHMWKANLKQNYFNTPWASISVAAAVIILYSLSYKLILVFVFDMLTRRLDYNGGGDGNGGDKGGGGKSKGMRMDFMGQAGFGYNYGYHAGNENGYPVGQLQCAQVVQS